MRTALKSVAICTILGGIATSAPCDTSNGPIGISGGSPLILEKNEGERRVWRPIEGAEGWDAQPGPFTLKVDRHNGGSSHLILGTEDLPPGAKIDRHRHPGADEILLLQNGSLGASSKPLVGTRSRPTTLNILNWPCVKACRWRPWTSSCAEPPTLRVSD